MVNLLKFFHKSLCFVSFGASTNLLKGRIFPLKSVTKMCPFLARHCFVRETPWREFLVSDMIFGSNWILGRLS